ncbi:MAG: HEPN domain-containing protein [Burkholderiaceae bacterium]
MNSEALLHKASKALSSAQLLLESGDADGACNRAYYAMFDAARAALMAFQKSDEVLTIKTHSGLIASFSLQLVKPGLIDIELGKSLNKVEDLRLIADYKGDAITFDDASWAVEQAQIFLMTIRSRFFSDKN